MCVAGGSVAERGGTQAVANGAMHPPIAEQAFDTRTPTDRGQPPLHLGPGQAVGQFVGLFAHQGE
jgi:hypothetical protein